MRAVSTVLDVALFLLLVGGAVAAVTAPVPDAEPDVPERWAGETATVLTTSTATVSYRLVPTADMADGSPEFDRHAHGTLARLIAAGALGGLAVDGTRVTRTREAYRDAVGRATRNATGAPGREVRVVAVWTPYRDANIEGRQVVGPTPPDGATVHSVTVRVPSGFPSTSDEANATAREAGYAGVARIAARATVDGLFPPNTTRLALRDDHPLDALVRHRYRRLGRLLGIDVDPKPTAVEQTNDRLEDRLTDRFEPRLRARFDSPTDAAQALSVGEVRVTVQVWTR